MQSPVILQINPKAPTYQIARILREYMSADEQRQLGYLLLHGADGIDPGYPDLQARLVDCGMAVQG